MGVRLLKSSNRFTAYSSHAIELKFGRMIHDISPHNRSEQDFLISPQGALGDPCVKRAPLKYSNGSAALVTQLIELNFVGRKKENLKKLYWTSVHQSHGARFSIFPRRRCGNVSFEIFKSILGSENRMD